MPLKKENLAIVISETCVLTNSELTCLSSPLHEHFKEQIPSWQMSSSVTNWPLIKDWFICARRSKSRRCWGLTSRLAATTNNSFSGFRKYSNPSTSSNQLCTDKLGKFSLDLAAIRFPWTPKTWSRFELFTNNRKLHQAAPGCTRLHQAAPSSSISISVVHFPHTFCRFQCKIIR
jgi:hypothetical protein